MEINRRNPAWLKLDLYCRGIRLSPGCFPEDTHGRPITRTRAGLGSGIEMILPQNLWTNVPVVEEFASRSPYELIREKESKGCGRRRRPHQAFHLLFEGEKLVPVTLPGCPAWYDQKTHSGKKMDRVGTLQGTYLAIYPAAVCEYWIETPRVNCRFCSVGLNLGYDDAEEKTIEDILEVVHAARRESGITYVDFNTGHYVGETYLDILEPMVRRIKAETDLLVGIQTPPHSDLSRYDRLQEMGVNRVSFCFELFDEEVFKKICPGKDREYGLERYQRAVEYCAGLSKKGSWKNPWVANGEIIVGLEPPESSIQAIEWMTGLGAIPTVCVFRPLKGTDMADFPSPQAEDLLPVFERLYSACMENHLPIGMAPNIHVSLVLLPDECRFLGTNPVRFRLAEQLRQIKACVFAAQFYTRRFLFSS